MTEESKNANKHVYILPSLHTALKLLAVQSGTTLTDLVNNILTKYINDNKPK